MRPLQPPSPARSPSFTPNLSPKSEHGTLLPKAGAGSLPLSRSPSPACAPRPLAPPAASRPSSIAGAATDTLGLGGLGLGLGLGHGPGATQAGTSYPPSRASLASPAPSRTASPSPRSQPKPLAPPSIDDMHWREGDFELVSSDNVRFRVASCHVLSASSVLGTAAEFDSAANRYDIHFADDEVESALVVRSFLRVITSGQVATTPDGSGTPSVAALRRLILFATKYECAVALQLVLFKIRELLARGVSVPMYTFILGATADDVETCCVSLRYMQQTWDESHAAGSGTGGSPGSVRAFADVRHEGTPGAPTIDPNNLPYTLWQWIPQDYMWALSRSWGKHVRDGTRLPEEFRRVIGIIKGVGGATTSAVSGARRASSVLLC